MRSSKKKYTLICLMGLLVYPCGYSDEKAVQKGVFSPSPLDKVYQKMGKDFLNNLLTTLEISPNPDMGMLRQENSDSDLDNVYENVKEFCDAYGEKSLENEVVNSKYGADLFYAYMKGGTKPAVDDESKADDRSKVDEKPKVDLNILFNILDSINENEPNDMCRFKKSIFFLQPIISALKSLYSYVEENDNDIFNCDENENGLFGKYPTLEKLWNDLEKSIKQRQKESVSNGTKITTFLEELRNDLERCIKQWQEKKESDTQTSLLLEKLGDDLNKCIKQRQSESVPNCTEITTTLEELWNELEKYIKQRQNESVPNCTETITNLKELWNELKENVKQRQNEFVLNYTETTTTLEENLEELWNELKESIKQRQKKFALNCVETITTLKELSSKLEESIKQRKEEFALNYTKNTPTLEELSSKLEESIKQWKREFVLNFAETITNLEELGNELKKCIKQRQNESAPNCIEITTTLEECIKQWQKKSALNSTKTTTTLEDLRSELEKCIKQWQTEFALNSTKTTTTLEDLWNEVEKYIKQRRNESALNIFLRSEIITALEELWSKLEDCIKQRQNETSLNSTKNTMALEELKSELEKCIKQWQTENRSPLNILNCPKISMPPKFSETSESAQLFTEEEKLEEIRNILNKAFVDFDATVLMEQDEDLPICISAQNKGDVLIKKIIKFFYIVNEIELQPNQKLQELWKKIALKDIIQDLRLVRQFICTLGIPCSEQEHQHVRLDESIQHLQNIVMAQKTMRESMEEVPNETPVFPPHKQVQTLLGQEEENCADKQNQCKLEDLPVLDKGKSPSKAFTDEITSTPTGSIESQKTSDSSINESKEKLSCNEILERNSQWFIVHSI